MSESSLINSLAEQLAAWIEHFYVCHQNKIFISYCEWCSRPITNLNLNFEAESHKPYIIWIRIPKRDNVRHIARFSLVSWRNKDFVALHTNKSCYEIMKYREMRITQLPSFWWNTLKNEYSRTEMNINVEELFKNTLHIQQLKWDVCVYVIYTLCY